MVSKQLCVSKCKKVLDKADKHIQNLNVQIDIQTMYIKKLESGLEETWRAQTKLEDELDSWYRQPELIGSVGVVIGVLLMGFAQK